LEAQLKRGVKIAGGRCLQLTTWPVKLSSPTPAQMLSESKQGFPFVLNLLLHHSNQLGFVMSPKSPGEEGTQPLCPAYPGGGKKSISETRQLKYLNEQVFKSQCGQKELLFSRC